MCQFVTIYAHHFTILSTQQLRTLKIELNHRIKIKIMLLAFSKIILNI